MSIISCSWGCLGVYIWRFKESKRICQLFSQTNGHVFINLQLAVHINNILTYLLGFCCFFSMIRFVHLCRINRRLTLFVRTLKYAKKELLSFGMMLALMFFAFICLFHLLFVSKMLSCSTLLKTAGMLFEITLMKFDASELIGAHAVLGPLAFALFILIIVFICLSMFLSIINESFRFAREEQIEEEHLLSFMFEKFLRWIGKSNATQIQERFTREQYIDPIQSFSNRMDELLEIINRVCLLSVLLLNIHVSIFSCIWINRMILLNLTNENVNNFSLSDSDEKIL